jgi:hypothetical protein
MRRGWSEPGVDDVSLRRLGTWKERRLPHQRRRAEAGLVTTLRRRMLWRASTDRRIPLWPAGRRGRLRPPCPPHRKGTAVPPNDRGLLARLDALVALVADRHGLALLPDGRLAAAEARVAARAAGVAFPTSVGLPTGPDARGRRVVERDAVELLRAVAEGVGLLRARGDRLEATSLRHAWGQIDESLRAGLTFAAWCQQVTFTSLRVSQQERLPSSPSSLPPYLLGLLRSRLWQTSQAQRRASAACGHARTGATICPGR